MDSTVVTGAGTQLAQRLTDAGVPVLTVPWALGADPRVAWGLLRTAGAGSILHAHDSHAHSIADATARIRPARVVVTRRVDLPVNRPAKYRRAAAVIAVSAAVQRRLLDAGVARQRIHLVPDAVDLTSIPDRVAHDGVRDHHPLVVSIAALTHEKGIDLLLESAARLRREYPTLRWLVVGEGAERSALEAQRSRLGLDDVVDLAGERFSPADALRRAAIAVQPSRNEGFGSAVLLALALGVPVVAASTGGLVDALASGGGLLVPPGSAMELADGVKRLLEDPDLRASMSDEGREAAQQFDVPRLVDRTLDVYRSIAHSQGRR